MRVRFIITYSFCQLGLLILVPNVASDHDESKRMRYVLISVKSKALAVQC